MKIDKICIECGELKKPFCKNMCNQCYNKNWKKAHPEYFKKWRENNKERNRELKEKWRENNREKDRECKRYWNKKNKETHAKINREYAKRHPEIIKAQNMANYYLKHLKKEGYEFHHPDYSKPLLVEVLPIEDHYKIHEKT